MVVVCLRASERSNHFWLPIVKFSLIYSEPRKEHASRQRRRMHVKGDLLTLIDLIPDSMATLFAACNSRGGSAPRRRHWSLLLKIYEAVDLI